MDTSANAASTVHLVLPSLLHRGAFTAALRMTWTALAHLALALALASWLTKLQGRVPRFGGRCGAKGVFSRLGIVLVCFGCTISCPWGFMRVRQVFEMVRER
jgi:hypothetical protein